MLPLEHSAILLTCIKRQSVLKTNFGSFFELLLKTGFTVYGLMVRYQALNELDEYPVGV